MSARKQDIIDFDFIFNESHHLQKLLNKSAYDEFSGFFDNKMHRIFSTINAPREMLEEHTSPHFFQLHTSSASQQKIREIALRFIKSNSLSFNITLSEFIHDLRDSIYIHAKNNINYNSKGYSKLLTRAYKRSERQMKSITYFFPFNAYGISEKIIIGDASIIPKDNILTRISEDENKFILDDISDEYDTFISIKIPKCSNDMSYKKALNTIDLIYGIIKVFAVYHQASTDKISLIHKPNLSKVTHHITYSDDYHISGTYQFAADYTKFWDSFRIDLSYDLGDFVKKLISYSTKPTDKNCISDRLIDSFCWFGDASQDTNSDSQIVKLVTSMERLITLPSERNDGKLTDRFAKRASCLIAVYYGEINQWEKDARLIYNLRSDLVHGSRSLYKSYSIPLLFNPFSIACYTLLSACVGFNKWGINETNYEPSLKRKYKLLIEHCQENHAEMNKKTVILTSSKE